MEEAKRPCGSSDAPSLTLSMLTPSLRNSPMCTSVVTSSSSRPNRSYMKTISLVSFPARAQSKSLAPPARFSSGFRLVVPSSVNHSPTCSPRRAQ